MPVPSPGLDSVKKKPRQTEYIGDSQGETNRAFSRRNRVFILREFIEQTLHAPAGSTVLDVAGGKGSLSWLLSNIDNRLDPRITDHTQMVRALEWLRKNPEEAAKRAVAGRPSYQPLAGLLSRIGGTVDAAPDSESAAPLALATPRHLRLLVDDALVEAVRSALAGGDAGASAWREYFEAATAKAEAATPLGYAQPSNRELASASARRAQGTRLGAHDDGESGGGGGHAGAQVRVDGGGSEGGHADDKSFRHSAVPLSAAEALAAIRRTSLVAGLHPDQATEAAIDLAFLLRVPFAIVPCCVFPSEFPDRRLRCGRPVHRYPDLLEYLQEKYPCTRVATLDFQSDTAKHVVLYTLPSDHDRAASSPTDAELHAPVAVHVPCPPSPVQSQAPATIAV